MPHVSPHAARWASAAVAVLGAGVLSAGLALTGSGSLTTSSAPARLVPATTLPAAPAVALPEVPGPPAAPVTRAPVEARHRVAPLGARRSADVQVAGRGPLAPEVLERLRALSPSVSFRSGGVRIGSADVPVVGVDPSTFRRWAAAGTAEASAVWQAVARGELVASHETAERLRLELGRPVRLTAPGRPAAVLRLGALATTGLPGADLVVSDAVGADLGLPADSALLLTARRGVDPVDLARDARGAAGGAAEVDLLTPPTKNPVAFLTGSRAAEAFGAFSYRYFSDGTIEPDAGWVRANIASQDLPVIGRATCHRIMLEQLRGALGEVEARGLGDTLRTYDGCYVPRFIERNPGGSISLHTWGIAIDFNAATNYRGIRGTMHPEVVAIFKRWGFRWGGDWQYTDPMHFELGAILDR